jgi:hypothetical protein
MTGGNIHGGVSALESRLHLRTTSPEWGKKLECLCLSSQEWLAKGSLHRSHTPLRWAFHAGRQKGNQKSQAGSYSLVNWRACKSNIRVAGHRQLWCRNPVKYPEARLWLWEQGCVLHFPRAEPASVSLQGLPGPHFHSQLENSQQQLLNRQLSRLRLW